MPVFLCVSPNDISPALDAISSTRQLPLLTDPWNSTVSPLPWAPSFFLILIEDGVRLPPPQSPKYFAVGRWSGKSWVEFGFGSHRVTARSSLNRPLLCPCEQQCVHRGDPEGSIVGSLCRRDTRASQKETPEDVRHQRHHLDSTQSSLSFCPEEKKKNLNFCSF